jgi:hypothetical protein
LEFSELRIFAEAVFFSGEEDIGEAKGAKVFKVGRGRNSGASIAWSMGL